MWAVESFVGFVGFCGVLWGFVGFCGVLWGFVGFCGQVWAGVGRCGQVWAGVGRHAVGGDIMASCGWLDPPYKWAGMLHGC